jgi:hypothetical protein
MALLYIEERTLDGFAEVPLAARDQTRRQERSGRGIQI